MNLPVWQGNNIPDLLEKIRQYVEAQVQKELDWYVTSKKRKGLCSRWLRSFAIAFTALGGAVPILNSMGLKQVGSVELSQLGYLFLGIAGALVGFDRYFGFSTSWMRFVTTMIGIEKSREQFRLDWLTLCQRLSRIQSGKSDDYAAATEAMLARARDFLMETKAATEKETEAWVAEFQTNLSQMEKDLQARLAAGRPGAVDVEVADGLRATGGMELYLDGLKVEDLTGVTGSIGNVPPGLHKITVKGKAEDRDFTTSKIVNVAASAVATLKLALGVPGLKPGEVKPSEAPPLDIQKHAEGELSAPKAPAEEIALSAPPIKNVGEAGSTSAGDQEQIANEAAEEKSRSDERPDRPTLG